MGPTSWGVWWGSRGTGLEWARGVWNCVVREENGQVRFAEIRLGWFAELGWDDFQNYRLGWFAEL